MSPAIKLEADATTIVVEPDAVFAVVVVTFACEYEFALIQTDTLNELPQRTGYLAPQSPIPKATAETPKVS